MKNTLILIFAFLICFSAGNLQCRASFNNGAETNTTCQSTEKYCAKFEASNEMNVPNGTPMAFKGCSHDLKAKIGLGCSGSGNFDVNGMNGPSMIQGELYCCSSDNCNLAAISFTFATVFSVVLFYVTIL